jgi:hypothetical protein
MKHSLPDAPAAHRLAGAMVTANEINASAVSAGSYFRTLHKTSNVTLGGGARSARLSGCCCGVAEGSEPEEIIVAVPWRAGPDVCDR